jgi:hypothetical protein
MSEGSKEVDMPEPDANLGNEIDRMRIRPDR